MAKQTNGPIGPSGIEKSASPIGATGPAETTQTDGSTDVLAEYSEHCLHYELDMLHRIRDLRTKSEALVAAVGEEWKKTFENVFVESFEVHARNLAEFFIKPPHRSEREKLVHVDNFLGSAEEKVWRTKNVTADQEKNLDDLWNLVSNNALHPMRSRTHDPIKKEIDFDRTVQLFDEIATAFVSAPGILRKLSRRRDWSRWNRRSTSSR